MEPHIFDTMLQDYYEIRSACCEDPVLIKGDVTVCTGCGDTCDLMIEEEKEEEEEVELWEDPEDLYMTRNL